MEEHFWNTFWNSAELLTDRECSDLQEAMTLCGAVVFLGFDFCMLDEKIKT